MCYGPPFAAVSCAFAVTSGGLAILGDNDMPRADRCCSVLCLPCYDRRARHNDVPRADRCCSVLSLPCNDRGACHNDVLRADRGCRRARHKDLPRAMNNFFWPNSRNVLPTF